MKYKLSLLLVSLISLFLIINSLAALEAPTPQFKQIAAPPSATELNTLPNPAEQGVRSDSAMLPVQLTADGHGRFSWQETIVIDGERETTFLLLGPENNDWQLSVQMPNEPMRMVDQIVGVSSRMSYMGMGNTQFPGNRYTFSAPESGEWVVKISSDSAKSGAQGYLVVDSDSPYTLYSHLTTYDLLVGNEIGLTTGLYNANNESDTAVPALLPETITRAYIILTAPDGQRQRLRMYDDGQHADGAAGDGIFGVLFTPDKAGDYTARVIARGVSPDRYRLIRTTQHVFPVLEPRLTLDEAPVATAFIGDNRVQLDLSADWLSEDVAPLLAFAEVWGQDAVGEPIQVAWIGGVTEPLQRQDNHMTIPLSLDVRWIDLAGAQAPFELRHVRVQDVNTAVPLAQLESVAVKMGEMPKLPASLDKTPTEITEEMLMGSRPTSLNKAASTNASATNVLMLVHGYCSSSVWPTADFTDYAVFADHNQNRSHDQFAQLIGTYGNNFDSFGVVAHSQGGAAALHLYTYYWSGLDDSSGNRLIQSVGTPYQGTALAGNLAALGEIFGAGCGTNWDLTYDGAALWLANIPGWARADVYYYTTAFEDKWWRYDYCQFATDLFLSDPDDGVIEKWAGQLSGANNMGHKSGWCHTNSMRDPAQYNDHGRNANMNANGNR